MPSKKSPKSESSPSSSSLSPLSPSSSSPTTPYSFQTSALGSTMQSIPQRLFEGIPVWQVSCSGKIIPSLLKLGEDKLTLLVLEYQIEKPSSATSLLFRPSRYLRSRSDGTAATASSNCSNTSNHNSFQCHPYFHNENMDSKNQSNNTKNFSSRRMIDVGAIERIQRGEPQLQQHHPSPPTPTVGGPGGLGGPLVPSSPAGSPQISPHRSFSIIFRGEPTLDLVCATPPAITTFSARDDELLDILDQIIKTYQEAKDKVANDVLLMRYVWLDIKNKDKSKSNSSKDDNTNNNEKVDVHQLSKIFDRINFNKLKKQELKKMYEQFGKVIGLDRSMRKKGLTLEQCCTFLHKIKRDSWIVKPVNVIWNEVFGEFMKNGKPRMTVSDKTFLSKFLHGKQGQTSLTIIDVQTIFQKLHTLQVKYVANRGNIDPNDTTRIDKERFEAYLLSSVNDAFDPNKQKFNQHMMTRPISEYWINSSHNTYLTGDQLISQSSVEMYSNALYRGCRCIELDIWDGDRETISTPTSENNSSYFDNIVDSKMNNSFTSNDISIFPTTDSTPIPVVYHGHTMTTKILFVDIIKAIKLFLNFHPDTFPIILSFENHCSIPYQEVMAEQLVKILGEKLYMPTEASLCGVLPSPMDLRGRVVIKGKRPSSVEAEFDESDDESMEDEQQQQQQQLQKITVPSRHGVSPALARLTTFHGCKHKNWDESIRNPTYHMHSFTESKVRSMAKQYKKTREWAIYNQSHMTRTYPAGSRVDSSNYSPYLAWSVGCQMVALNYQTTDVHLRANDGRFRENGNCGYVLKPSEVIQRYIHGNNCNEFDTITTTTSGTTSTTASSSYFNQNFYPIKIAVKVLSGSCIPKPKGSRTGDCINPYVKVTVFDVKNGDDNIGGGGGVGGGVVASGGRQKETITSYSTTVIQSNGLFPIWNQERFSFHVENQAIAILQLSVYDKDMRSTANNIIGSDDFIASSSIPISCLRKGIRSVKLYDSNNTRTGAFDFASLLIDVKSERLVGEI